MNPPYDRLLVRVPKLHDDEIQLGSLTLHKDTSYDEEKYRTTWATVIASPLGLNSGRYLPQTKGGPRFTYADIRQVPSAGDTVYLKWSALEEAARPDPLNHPDMYSVDLSQVVALPDGCGGFLGYGGYVLCEPIYPEVENEAGTVGTTTASGLLLISNVKDSYTEGDESNIKGDIPTKNGVPAIKYEGMVRYTGTPLRNQLDEVKSFDQVVFDHSICSRDGYPLLLVLEGREFFCVRRDAIAVVRQPRRPVLQLNANHLVVEEPQPQKLAA